MILVLEPAIILSRTCQHVLSNLLLLDIFQTAQLLMRNLRFNFPVEWIFSVAAPSANGVMKRRCAIPSMWHTALNSRLITESCSHPPTPAQSAAAGGPLTASLLTFQSEQKIKITPSSSPSLSFFSRLRPTPERTSNTTFCFCLLKRWPHFCPIDKPSWHCVRKVTEPADNGRSWQGSQQRRNIPARSRPLTQNPKPAETRDCGLVCWFVIAHVAVYGQNSWSGEAISSEVREEKWEEGGCGGGLQETEPCLEGQIWILSMPFFAGGSLCPPLHPFTPLLPHILTGLSCFGVARGFTRGSAACKLIGWNGRSKAGPCWGGVGGADLHFSSCFQLCRLLRCMDTPQRADGLIPIFGWNDGCQAS